MLKTSWEAGACLDMPLEGFSRFSKLCCDWIKGFNGNDESLKWANRERSLGSLALL